MAGSQSRRHSHEDTNTATPNSKAASSPKEVSSSKKRKASPTSSQIEDVKVSKVDENSGENADASSEENADASRPPLPDEPTPPPLPNEEPPPGQEEDDGWQPVWDDTNQAFYFYNRFTHATQWDNPRVPTDQPMPTNHDRIAPGLASSASNTDTAEVHPAVAGGYNPAIHGSYDPNADYAQYISPQDAADAEAAAAAARAADPENYAAAAHFNRFTGRFQSSTLQPSNFNDESKAKKQMNAFFDVDAAANSHDGRSLRAERAGKKLSKSEVKQFKERRRERKEEKRRAWLRD